MHKNIRGKYQTTNKHKKISFSLPFISVDLLFSLFSLSPFFFMMKKLNFFFLIFLLFGIKLNVLTSTNTEKKKKQFSLFVYRRKRNNEMTIDNNRNIKICIDENGKVIRSIQMKQSLVAFHFVHDALSQFSWENFPQQNSFCSCSAFRDTIKCKRIHG